MKLSSKKIFKKVFEGFVLLVILTSVSFGLLLEPDFKIYGWAEFDETKLFNQPHSLTILDDEGDIINSIIQDEQLYIPFNKIPSNLKNAFISVEDKRFYKHDGIDYIRIASAIKNNIKAKAYAEGASTITQQLTKNTHLTNEKKISRKLQEMRIAIDIERNYSKDEILEIYLNILDFGNNIYGIGNASKAMFGKDINELSIAQSALLSGIINNPSRFNPYSNPEKAIKRRNVVLYAMRKEEKINEEEYNKALNEELILQKLDKSHSEYFNSVVKEASELLNCSVDEIYTKNITIGTNLDLSIHSSLQDIIDKLANEHNDYLTKAIIINNLSGNIVALSSQAPFNIASSHRQPGSVIKPFLSYVPLLENDLIVPTTPILDQKMDFGDFSPSNYKNKYDGWTTINNSLIKSSNVCAVKLMEMNGIENSIKTGEKFGLTFSSNDNSLALSLGSMQNGLTLTQLANAYQVFANNGYYIKSAFIDYILDEKGQTIYTRKISQHKACSPETAFFMNTMLKDCTQNGTAKKLKRHKKICAKTGTVGDNFGNTDAYCIAYSPEYTVAMWIGSYDYTKRIVPTGGGLPAELVAKVFDTLPDNYSDFIKPDTIVEVDINTQILNSKHKIVAANNTTLPKHKRKEYFKKTKLPKSY